MHAGGILALAAAWTSFTCPAAPPGIDDAHATNSLSSRIAAEISRLPTCYPANLSEEEWQRILDEFGGRPPTQLNEDMTRYYTDTTVWTGDGAQGPSTRAQPAHLTYSFPADGTTWGLSAISATGPNDLNARLIAHHGAGNLDLGREYIRQGLAAWRKYGGLTYTEVADDNAPMDQNTARVPTRGDVRIGGLGFGTGTFLAYNAFPSAAGAAGVGGGDMCFNTSFFTPGEFNNASDSYRYLRNTASHEHGHGLGNIHSVPCNGTKLMEPSISLAFDVVQVDERRGAGRNYGDRLAGNHSALAAVDLGDLAAPPRSVIERDLSTNGASGFGGTNEDWFRFTLSNPEDMTIIAAPTGGSYSQAQQLFGCFAFGQTTVNAAQAGNLNIELRSADGSAVLMTAASAGAGATETLSAGTLGAGTYTVRVFDAGPNASANQTVQLYDLTIRAGTTTAPPQAIAGLNKRVAANTNCFFLGDINSRATDAGATLNNGSYEWDLDGDGAFEITGNPRPTMQYVSNGAYDVTLRLTDSLGGTGTDTIQVIVFGATTNLSGVSPGSGQQGATVPVTITGTNLKNVAGAAEFTVSGGGVSVIGTPTPNSLGTSVSGLSFLIDAGAALGARDVSISNADGSATAIGAFTIEAGSGALLGDMNCDGIVSPSDIAGFVLALTNPLQYALEYPDCNILNGDINGDELVTPSDIAGFVAILTGG